MSVILLIVDPWQYCVCCIRLGVTRCTLLMVLYLDLASAGYTRCSGRTSVHLCAASLQNLAVYHMTFIPLLVSLWNDLANPVFDFVGLADFNSRANAFDLIGLSCPIPTINFCYFFPFSSL